MVLLLKFLWLKISTEDKRLLNPQRPNGSQLLFKLKLYRADHMLQLYFTNLIICCDQTVNCRLWPRSLQKVIKLSPKQCHKLFKNFCNSTSTSALTTSLELTSSSARVTSVKPQHALVQPRQCSDSSPIKM